VKEIARRVVKELVFAVVAAVVFSVRLILGHLQIYQEWPRWK